MKILKIFLFAFFFQLFLLVNPFNVSAQPFEDDACGFKVECLDPVNCTMTPGGTDIIQGTNKVKFSFDLSKIPADLGKLYADYDPDNGIPDILDKNLKSAPYSFSLCNDMDQFPTSPKSIIEDTRPYRIGDCTFRDTTLRSDDPGDPGPKQFFLNSKDYNHSEYFTLCVGNYSIVVKPIDVTIEVLSKNGLYDIESEWDVKITYADASQIPPFFNVYLDNEIIRPAQLKDPGNYFDAGLIISRYFTLFPQPTGTHTIELTQGAVFKDVIATATFKVWPKDTFFCDPPNSCTPVGECKYPVAPGEGICQGNGVCCQPDDIGFCGECGPNNTFKCDVPKCVELECPNCKTVPSIQPLPSLRPLCEQVPSQFQGDCLDCMVNDKGEYGTTGIWTAVGCISTDLGGFVTEFIYGIGLKFAGAIAFLYFLYGAFLYLTSGGNPEKVAMGKEVIVSSLSGLLLLIFSLFLLKIIAIDILEIPGFVP